MREGGVGGERERGANGGGNVRERGVKSRRGGVRKQGSDGEKEGLWRELMGWVVVVRDSGSEGEGEGALVAVAAGFNQEQDACNEITISPHLD